MWFFEKLKDLIYENDALYFTQMTQILIKKWIYKWIYKWSCFA